MFITPHGLYCYNVTPVGLKNVRATYRRFVIEIFLPLLGNTMEADINNMLVKSKERFDHIQHLQETFELLRKHDIKLNPLKCAFGISSSKFLGFMVTQRGIEANPVQLKSIMESQAPYLQERSTTTDWLASSPRVIHILFHRSVKAIFYHAKGS